MAQQKKQPKKRLGLVETSVQMELEEEITADNIDEQLAKFEQELQKELDISIQQLEAATVNKAFTPSQIKAMTEKPEPTALDKAMQSVDPILLSILQRPRRHESKGEKAFLKELQDLLISLAKTCGGEYLEHAMGVPSLSIPMASGGPSTTLFSCHIDTCDNFQDEEPKAIDYDPDFRRITLAKGSRMNCLGADDGIGVWIMLNMVYAKVPGTYVFHRGEEVGCLSSKKMAELEAPWLKKFELAIAFDRPHHDEVITHQMAGTECASEKFGVALAKALNEHDFKYSVSKKGVVTDTAQYRYLIAECINLGVGYQGQHGPEEEQDYEHAYKLMKAAIAIRWDALPVDRDPIKAKQIADEEAKKSSYSYSSGYNPSKPYKPAAPVHQQAPAPKQQAYVPGFKDYLPEDLRIAVEAVEEMTQDEIFNATSEDVDTIYNAVQGLMLERDMYEAQVNRYRKMLGHE